MENKESSQDEKAPAAETEMEVESNKKSEPIILKAASKFGNWMDCGKWSKISWTGYLFILTEALSVELNL